jgi:hypothetical protein
MPPAGVIVSKAVIREVMAGVAMAAVVVSEAPMMPRPVPVPAVTVPAVPMSTVPTAMSAVSTTPLGEGRRGREESQCDDDRGCSQLMSALHDQSPGFVIESFEFANRTPAEARFRGE